MKAVVCLFGVLCSPFLFAQGTGTIHGSVKDPSGLAVPSVQVTATLGERGTVRSVATNAEGSYVFPLLSIGTYVITAEGTGFKQFRQTGITLDANDNVRVDAVLEVGQVSERVTV